MERASDVIGLLIRLAEHDDPILTEREVAEVPGARTLRRWGALQPAEAVTEMLCRACDGGHPVEPSFEDGAWIYFCPEAGLVKDAVADLNCFAMAEDWLPRAVAAALRLPPTSFHPIVEGKVWELGVVRSGERLWGAMFTRCVGSREGLGTFLSALRNRPHATPGLVLTTSRLPASLQLPGGNGALHLADCARMTPSGLALDEATLGRALRAGRSGGSDPARGRGRPGSKRLYVEEHRRRLSTGEAHAEVGAEARELAMWIAKAHPAEFQPDWTTIRTVIGAAHRAHFSGPAASGSGASLP